jgi:SPP1 family predicted phage head-tail adaptor
MMAWVKVTVKTDNGEWVAQQSSTASNAVFSVPFDAALNGGDSFTVDGKAFTVINSVDLAQRGETLLVEAKESNDGKRKTRRSENIVGGENPDGQSDD